MPLETKDAIAWALTQQYQEQPVTLDNPPALVDTVCIYFADHNIAYGTFNYHDLVPYFGE